MPNKERPQLQRQRLDQLQANRICIALLAAGYAVIPLTPIYPVSQSTTRG